MMLEESKVKDVAFEEDESKEEVLGVWKVMEGLMDAIMLMWRLLDEDEKFHAFNVRESLRVPA